MSSTRRWVIGRGLLGRAVERTRPDDAFSAVMPWADPDRTIEAFHGALAQFADSGARLEIYWCAGRGVTSTPAEQLATEAIVFERALEAVAQQPSDVRSRLTFFLASSVGGAYAGSGTPPFTESTPVAPLSAYGETKLRMERALEDATADGRWRSLVGRITNLYGAGQDLSKPQGLISALVKGHVNGQPTSVYVPLDTLRDYIYEDDCAAVIDAGMRRVADEAPGTTVTKLIGAMRAVSIGALLSELSRLRRRRGPVVLGGGDARGQALDLRIRSEVWTDLDGLVRTTLPEGLSRVYQAQLLGRASGH
jgi:UDP-glucose 4-epimerase